MDAFRAVRPKSEYYGVILQGRTLYCLYCAGWRIKEQGGLSREPGEVEGKAGGLW